MTDGCVYLLYNRSWKFRQLGAGQLLSGQPVRYGKYRRYSPSITYKIHTMPGHSPPFAIASASCAELPDITDSKTYYTLYGPEAILHMHLTDCCRFLNCSVRMGGRGWGVEGYVMNSQATFGGREGGGAVRYEFITSRSPPQEVQYEFITYRSPPQAVQYEFIMYLSPPPSPQK
jgi:hypothetical protein